MMQKRRTIFAIGIFCSIIIVDQLIKWAVKTNFSLYESVEITGWFQLLFTENQGMAFGMDFIGTMFLAVFRIVAIAFFSVVLVRMVRNKAPYGMLACASLVIAGALGNLIDNAFYGLIFTESLPYAAPAHVVPFGEGYGTFLSGKVVDMFYFPLFTWPDWLPLFGGHVFFGAIFNLADAAISCGAVALLLFYGRQLNSKGLYFMK